MSSVESSLLARPSTRAVAVRAPYRRSTSIADLLVPSVIQAGMTYAEISGSGGKESEELYPVRTHALDGKLTVPAWPAGQSGIALAG
jgi:hypothetical protein